MPPITTLRPKLLQSLLEGCTSIKVKRLFLYMANKAGHDWLKRLDIEKLDLGTGSRTITKGLYDARFTACEDWSDDQKIKVIIAVGECGYDFDLAKDDPDDFDIDLYELDSLKDLAEQFIEEGLFGEIPATIRHYLDYDAIGRDLGVDYSEIRLNGTNYVYRMG